LTGALHILFIAPVATTTSMTLSSNKIQNGDILEPANPGPPGKWPLKWRECGRLPLHTRSSADADNRLDAFSGQSRSTNMVPFHMLHIGSYCAIVTLSLRQVCL